MGIRFACPNGHRLNVKAEFAGKRAICPECRAKVVVPVATDENHTEPASSTPSLVAERAPAGTPTSTGKSPATLPPSSPPSSPSPQPTPPTTPPGEPAADGTPPVAEAGESSPPPAPAEYQWHVRAATGDQYGPADAGTMKQWIAEGRVAADSWVWRTGWSEWQPGTVALEAFGPAPPQQPDAALAASDQTVEKPAQGGPLTAAEQRRRTLARRRRRTVQVTVGLIVLTAVLAVVLAVVLLS